MITAAHTIIYAEDADAARAFFRDVLGFPSADAGGGWLIFGLPPAELAAHPGEASGTELYLMCDDLEATVDDLKPRGIEFSPVSEARWGRLTKFQLPGGSQIGLYEPHHPRAIDL
jgi:catechol 2,3-dioxygenase-like lactoylglutathione lyase family enzyme